MSRLSNLIARFGTLTALVALAAAPAVAADTDAALPPATPSHQTVPEAGAPASGGSGEPLSEKLDRQGGVLRPPSGIDPGITQQPPAEGKTPVIAPPGTADGEPGVRPK